MSPNMQMRLKPETLARYNLPDIPWPLPIAAFAAAVSEPAELPFAEMLFALQNQSDDEPSIWKSLEPAMNRLAELVSEDLKAFPPDDQLLAIGSETWWLELGPVDLTKTDRHTPQRRDHCSSLSSRRRSTANRSLSTTGLVQPLETAGRQHSSGSRIWSLHAAEQLGIPCGCFVRDGQQSRLTRRTALSAIVSGPE